MRKRKDGFYYPVILTKSQEMKHRRCYGLNIQREEMWNETKYRFWKIVKTCWTSRCRKTCRRGGKKRSGSAGASGLDAVLVSAWLLKFGGTSKILRTVITRLVEYLSNGYPHWASYRAMMYCREIGLDKCPGVRPIGIGDIFRRL